MNVQENTSIRIDIPFTVPFVHRLRFTRDLLGSEPEVLAEVLEPSGKQPARVQLWLDGHVAGARPSLAGSLCELLDSHPERFRRTGAVEIVPGGEAIKNDIHLLEKMLKTFEEADLDRRSYVLVVGGGAVLDAVGFAAAIAHRGLRLVRLPTTTLSQADSGVGVKNSVNLFGKKNWIGTFAVPWAVINDAALLESLPDRDFICGFSEAVKVSLLKDRGLFERLCREAGRIRQRDPEATLPVIQASAEWHLRHITRGGDPFENEMARPLDYGHWSAHKLEIMTHFGLRHGEAVAIGVAIDSLYSARVHGLARADAERVLRCLAEMGFPLGHPALEDREPLFAGLEEFRQHLGGELTVTMLRGVGEPIDAHEIDRAAMEDAIDEVQMFAKEYCARAADSEAISMHDVLCKKHCQ
jgi:3-dehydroquinate synthase